MPVLTIMTDVRLERQLRYYFSDKNLWKDEWLMNQLGDDGTGFIPADIIAGFNRVQQILVCSSEISRFVLYILQELNCKARAMKWF